jgi:hypothetical protein
MIRRSGNKIYTKVTQYFTDDSSPVGYSHSLTSPTESFCGTNFYYEQRLTSSLANGKWRDCLYGPFTFCSGSTSGSACESVNCSQFYLDTATINIDYTGVMLDETSNVTLYTGSRLYLSSSLELAPDAYYASGSTWYQVGTGNAYGYNAGTIIISGSCTVAPPPITTYSFIGSGRGNDVYAACNDAGNNNRTLYSNCTSGTFGVNCYVYVDQFPNALTGYTNVFMNGASWDINSSTGQVTAYSSTQC